jgi:beta-1,2-mannobiose phosphorylase / 1,2-beta-oligomannan phosphorylase
MKNQFKLRVHTERLGVLLSPNGDPLEKEGLLNPAFLKIRGTNRRILLPRVVAHGNQSRVGEVEILEHNGKYHAKRLGYALEPETWYEKNGIGGEGCEDPRVTYVPVLGMFVMVYTAYSAQGPRIAIATSETGRHWIRLGLVEFPPELNLFPDDKDGMFFPDPVVSPKGEVSLAMYHRPMVGIPLSGTLDQFQSILAAPAESRQSMRIAYIPLAPVQKDLSNLLKVAESVITLTPSDQWGTIKVGAGTPPELVDEGYISLYHGVDAVAKNDGSGKYAMHYRAGIVIHDAIHPEKVLYCSEKPILWPRTKAEKEGVVNNVVFPTGWERRTDLEEARRSAAYIFDVYYGMADYKIGVVRITVERVKPLPVKD